MTKVESLADLRRRIESSTAATMYPEAKNLVFFRGDPESKLVILGEAPGAQEDEAGMPFVGPSGKLVNETLKKVGFAGDPYITNVVLRRPPGNRTPTSDEVAESLPWLKAQLEVVRPTVVLALGKTASTTMLGWPTSSTMRTLFTADKFVLGDVRGRLVCCYHPSYILRCGRFGLEYQSFLSKFTSAVEAVSAAE